MAGTFYFILLDIGVLNLVSVEEYVEKPEKHPRKVSDAAERTFRRKITV